MMACNRGPKVPKGVLQPDKMEDVLWDMIQTGEFLSGYVLYRDTNINAVLESQRWYEKVYSFHQISKEDFKRSYNWYRDHPDMMKRILDSLSVRKDPEPTPAAVAKDSSSTSSPDTARLRKDTTSKMPGSIRVETPGSIILRDSIKERRKRALQKQN
ncbi:MAG: DUF4296 domain-containing protein [Sphingobacteriales bacterium]|nr:DUF4296 domain-containing protein [Sphingobacteriales bacterium]NCT75715.1 DUF4296 domain-containing protein [Chitinophagaceae bacterium]OJW30819.1 MAG: hypothetical protein BGO54_23220 [Sphingobacteriales bacterium 46-32]